MTLAPQTTGVVDPAKPAGSVADLSPGAGIKAKQGAIVRLEVYTGNGQVKVPSIVGTTPGLADQALRASRVFLQQRGAGAGRTAKAAGRASSAGVAVGGLTPEEVAAYAGKGPITIPALSGDPITAAGKLSQLGLMPIPVNHLATVPVGKVAGTDPAAGVNVAKRGQVDLMIASGPLCSPTTIGSPCTSSTQQQASRPCSCLPERDRRWRPLGAPRQAASSIPKMGSSCLSAPSSRVPRQPC